MGAVLIVDTQGTFAGQVEASLVKEDGVEVSVVSDLTGARGALEACEPHVVVIGPSVEPMDSLDFARALSSRQPESTAVLVADEVTTDLLRAALRAGLKDVLSLDDSAEDVAAAVMLAYDAAQAERIRSGHAAETESADRGAGAKVVTVFSTKGGVGKSVIATNLGVAIAELGYSTILLDLDLQFGDTGIMLQLRPTRTIFDAMLSYDRLDPDMLRGFLTKHSSGLQVLLAPIHPEDADSITASRVARVITLLRELADVVVIDTPGAFTDIVLAALDKSDEVYAVATMDVASIKNTRISLQKLLQLGYDDGRIRIVLNRADSKVWIEQGEVESAVEGEIVAKIPSDRLVPRSVNKGVPVVADAPKSPVAKSLVSLAEFIAARNGEGV